jgi:prepilin signal peptidase PulO-like enzyme (type II secretory pathway)
LQLPAGITEEALFQWGVVFGTSLAAAIFDLRSKRIPNALTIPLLVAGLVWATWIGGLSGLGNAAAACFLLALPYVFLFLFAKGGAGDAKLMGAIGAWLFSFIMCGSSSNCYIFSQCISKKAFENCYNQCHSICL